MSEIKKCPNCKSDVPELVSIDEARRKEFTAAFGETTPAAVCANCLLAFERKINSQKDKEQRRATKEANRLSLWRRRVDIMRDARDRFAEKDFAGAVVSYEKYLRVIEMIYDVKPNQLKVSFFNNPARAKELVLITIAYWDLLRIYDQSDRFHKRFQECGEKLIDFLPFTPMYSEMIHKIEEHRKTAKHKEVFNKILKQVKKKKKRCFIATAAFEGTDSRTVELLCIYRDTVLVKSEMGRSATKLYYYLSPPIAEILDHSSALRSLARPLLSRMAQALDEKYHLKRHLQ
jgi:hypothetical protein